MVQERMPPVHPIRAAVVATLLALLPACSLMAPSMQALAIATNEPLAEIFVDGAKVGTGSTSVEVRRNKSHAIVARSGEKSVAAAVGTSISTTGVLDIIGGIFFLIPLIGLAGPGFWDLDSDAVTLTF